MKSSKLNRKSINKYSKKKIYGGKIIDTSPNLLNNCNEWKEITNNGDGHCFFYTILRFLAMNPDVDNLGINISEYSLEMKSSSQQPSQVSRIRKLVKIEIEDNYNFDMSKKNNILERLNRGIVDSNSNNSTDAWAQNEDVIATSRIFNICICIWRPIEQHWEMYYPTMNYDDGTIKIDEEDITRFHKGCKGVKCCYMINTNENHFDTLISNSTKSMTKSSNLNTKKYYQELNIKPEILNKNIFGDGVGKLEMNILNENNLYTTEDKEKCIREKNEVKLLFDTTRRNYLNKGKECDRIIYAELCQYFNDTKNTLHDLCNAIYSYYNKYKSIDPHFTLTFIEFLELFPRDNSLSTTNFKKQHIFEGICKLLLLFNYDDNIWGSNKKFYKSLENYVTGKTGQKEQSIEEIINT